MISKFFENCIKSKLTNDVNESRFYLQKESIFRLKKKFFYLYTIIISYFISESMAENNSECTQFNNQEDWTSNPATN